MSSSELTQLTTVHQMSHQTNCWRCHLSSTHRTDKYLQWMETLSITNLVCSPICLTKSRRRKNSTTISWRRFKLRGQSTWRKRRLSKTREDRALSSPPRSWVHPSWISRWMIIIADLWSPFWTPLDLLTESSNHRLLCLINALKTWISTSSARKWSRPFKAVLI